MNFLLEPETDFATMNYILRRQLKEAKRYKPTVPFHTVRKCEDRTRCAFHRRKN